LAKKTEKERPEKLLVGGVPYQLVEHPYTGEPCRQTSYSDYVEQEISITKDIPFPRWLSYLSGEVAYLLLNTNGKGSTANSRRLGPVFYRFIRENKLDWIYADEVGEPPTTLFVNGIPYVLKAPDDTYLKARNCIGEIDYAMLTIRIHSKLKPEARAVTFLHEATHALLYEARMLELCHNEVFVEPFSALLFQLFKQNDFSFAYNGE
jgi:hypothetical protein